MSCLFGVETEFKGWRQSVQDGRARQSGERKTEIRSNASSRRSQNRVGGGIEGLLVPVSEIGAAEGYRAGQTMKTEEKKMKEKGIGPEVRSRDEKGHNFSLSRYC